MLPADNPRAFAFRQRANLFGYNAPDWRTMPQTVHLAFDDRTPNRVEWPNFVIPANHIDLDAAYPKIVADSWVVLSVPGYVETYLAKQVDVASGRNFALTGKVTRIVPDTLEHLSFFGLRETSVFAQSEELQIARTPVTGGGKATRSCSRAALPSCRPRLVIVTGKRARLRSLEQAR
jgi:hypothetical protein